MSGIRLQRALARAGVASRRNAENLIRAGCVRVNRRVAALGARVDPANDVITVNGRRIRPVSDAWIALHKPIGYVVTRRDPQGRKTVFDLVPEIPGLTYVGRLDLATTGLLLFTTDGSAANQLTHPRYAVTRTYRARVRGQSIEQLRGTLARPIEIDGRIVGVTRWHAEPGRRGAVQLTLTLVEGRKRIVRRMCEALGLSVEALVRLTHGPIRLGRLGPGEWRYLSARERAAIRHSISR